METISLAGPPRRQNRMPGRAGHFCLTLSSLHRSGGGRFLVYFDGDDPDRAAMPPGISVRYSAPYSADEAMARRLREIQHPAEIIIVTNDRQLMTQCRNEGAKTMTWPEFTAKMQTTVRPFAQRRMRRKNRWMWMSG